MSITMKTKKVDILEAYESLKEELVNIKKFKQREIITCEGCGDEEMYNDGDLYCGKCGHTEEGEAGVPALKKEIEKLKKENNELKDLYQEWAITEEMREEMDATNIEDFERDVRNYWAENKEENKDLVNKDLMTLYCKIDEIRDLVEGSEFDEQIYKIFNSDSDSDSDSD